MSTGATALQAAIERVGKVLALEERQGHQNRAVIGGIAPFTRQGLASLRGALPTRAADDALARIALLLRDYATLAPDARQPLLSDALIELRKLYRLVRDLGENDPTAQPRYIGPPANRKPKPAPAKATPEAAKSASAAAKVKVITPQSPVTDLPSVGDGRAIQLGQIGVRTVNDLLYLLPRRYMDYSQEYLIAHAFYGQEGTVKGEVLTIEEKRLPGGKTLVVAEVADHTGMVTATWFSPYIARALQPGAQVVLSGKIGQRRGKLVLENPEWEQLDADLLHTGRIVPIYPLTKGLYQKPLRNIVRRALDACADRLPEYLPLAVRQRAQLLPLPTAIRAIHFPPDDDALRAARHRLGFDEFFLVQLGMQQRKRQWQLGAPGHVFAVDEAVVKRFLGVLPFELTGAQRACADRHPRRHAPPLRDEPAWCRAMSGRVRRSSRPRRCWQSLRRDSRRR